MRNSHIVNPDEFSMWRAVFAFALVDGVLSIEEQDILAIHMTQTPFTKMQLEILRNDMTSPQDVEALYNQILDKNNKQRFCELARTLVWCDGDIERQEKEILERVSCLGHKENKDILNHSSTSDWMRAYTDKYENIAFMNSHKSCSLFEAQA